MHYEEIGFLQNTLTDRYFNAMKGTVATTTEAQRFYRYYWGFKRLIWLSKNENDIHLLHAYLKDFKNELGKVNFDTPVTATSGVKKVFSQEITNLKEANTSFKKMKAISNNDQMLLSEKSLLKNLKENTPVYAPPKGLSSSVFQFYSRCKEYEIKLSKIGKSGKGTLKARIHYDLFEDQLVFNIRNHLYLVNQSQKHTLIKHSFLYADERIEYLIDAAIDLALKNKAPKLVLFYESVDFPVATILEKHSIPILKSGPIFGSNFEKPFTALEIATPKKRLFLNEKPINEFKKELEPSPITKKTYKQEDIYKETYTMSPREIEKKIKTQPILEKYQQLISNEKKLLEEMKEISPFMAPKGIPTNIFQFCAEAKKHEFKLSKIGESGEGYLTATLLYQKFENQLLVTLRNETGSLIKSTKLHAEERLEYLIDGAIKLARENHLSKTAFIYDPKGFPVSTILNKHNIPMVSRGSLSTGINEKSFTILEIATPKEGLKIFKDK